MTLDAPPLRFPDELRADLEAVRVGFSDELEQQVRSLARPCITIVSQRVSSEPLRRSSLRKIFGAKSAGPVLGVLDSKWGGTPYSEGPEDWSKHAFLGQIDLAVATALLPDGAPKLTGLLRLDYPTDTGLELRVRWFREPDAHRAVPVSVESRGAWEARMIFKARWTLPEGKELEAIWPFPDDERCTELSEIVGEPYYVDGVDEFHRLLGCRASGLDENYGFEPPPGASAEIETYDMLLRLTFDNVADFGWGSNWVYLIVPRGDLASGDLSRIRVTGGNW